MTGSTRGRAPTCARNFAPSQSLAGTRIRHSPASTGSMLLGDAVLLIPEGAKFEEASPHCPLVFPDSPSTKPRSNLADGLRWLAPTAMVSDQGSSLRALLNITT